VTAIPNPRRPGDGEPRPASHPAIEPDWDVGVLARPVVLDVPDLLPADPDPLLTAAVAAMAATAFGDPQAPDRVAELGRAGVVALRTSSGSFELRESLIGWLLVRAWGDPDPADLAAAAELRAERLAAERRGWRGDTPPDQPGAGR
jgi:hypothetical protein